MQKQSRPSMVRHIGGELRRILRVGLNPFSKQSTALDRLIPAEIRGDSFYRAIQRYAASDSIRTILEIGSSAGTGSTQAFVTGILLRRSTKPQLYCLELSAARFKALRKAYKDRNFVHPYNLSSVPLGSFPSEETVIEFYRNRRTNLNQYPLPTVLEWLRNDIAYLAKHGKNNNGIQVILQEQGLSGFDLVLIDGSEFTGHAELRQVVGAKILMLDDINSFKNFDNYQNLKANPEYTLVEEDWALRNGYAIFSRNSP